MALIILIRIDPDKSHFRIQTKWTFMNQMSSVVKWELFRILRVYKEGRAWGSISPKKEFCEGCSDHPLTFSHGACEKGKILGFNSNLLNQNPSSQAQNSTSFTWFLVMLEYLHSTTRCPEAKAMLCLVEAQPTKLVNQGTFF